MLRYLLLAATLSCVGLPPVASAQETWFQWRGPHRDGKSPDTGLLERWEETPPLVWKAEEAGTGYSSVSIDQGVVCTMGDVGDSMMVMAFSDKDGTKLWDAKIGEAWEPGGYAGPRCTPTIDGDRLYVIGTHGDLACLELATGKLVWAKSFKDDFGGRIMSGWGFSESPLVDGDKLVCTPGGPEAGIVALNKMTGEEIWRSALTPDGTNGTDGAGYSSIVISQGAGVKQYVQLTGRGLFGVDAETGKQLWNYNRIANAIANIPTPIVRDDYVFTSNGYGIGSALLKLSKTDDGVSAEEVYFLDGRKLQVHHGGMVLVGDHVYAGHGLNNGFPVCIDFLTGEEVWRKGRGAGSGSAAISYADGNLYFRYQSGVLALVRATPDGYEERGKFDVPNDGKPSWAHPSISGGRLYVREQDAIYCYDLRAQSE